jgi:hypothetical protein
MSTKPHFLFPSLDQNRQIAILLGLRARPVALGVETTVSAAQLFQGVMDSGVRP